MDRELIQDYLTKTGMNDVQAEALSRIFAEMATKSDMRSLEQRLDSRMSALEQKLESKISALEQRLESSLQIFDQKLDKQGFLTIRNSKPSRPS